MLKTFLYRLSAGVYYLLLGLWAGVLAGFALAAPALFYRLDLYQPTIGRTPPSVPPMEGPTSRIIAGDIANHILANLATMQIVAATGVAVLLILQCTVFRDHLARRVTSLVNWTRAALLALAVAGLALQLGFFSPQLDELRHQMYDPDQTPSVRAAARSEFETYHTLSERTLSAVLLLVAGTVVVSPFVLSPANRRQDAAEPQP